MASEDRVALAARASPWDPPLAPRLAIREHGLVLGAPQEAIELVWSQLFHLEPVDPWPSLAIGWIDRGDAYTSVLTPVSAPDAFAAIVESLFDGRAASLDAASPGWLEHPVVAWEPVGALPGEADLAPELHGYREAPRAPDPVVARRSIAGGAALTAWIAGKLRRSAHRLDPTEIVVTRAFVYARTRDGDRVRLPVASLRAVRRTESGDAIYTFGRRSELLVAHGEDAALTTALDALVAR
jgi:hypothetical protein